MASPVEVNTQRYAVVPRISDSDFSELFPPALYFSSREDAEQALERIKDHDCEAAIMLAPAAVPVRHFAEYCQPYCVKRLPETLPIDHDHVHSIDILMSKSIDTALGVYLAEDWRFREIEEMAEKQLWHSGFDNLKFRSARRLLWSLALELEEQLWKCHAQLSTAALTDFWGSWQVAGHFHKFGVRLEPHLGQLRLTRPEFFVEPRSDAEIVADARLVQEELLHIYTEHLGADQAVTEPAPAEVTEASAPSMTTSLLPAGGSDEKGQNGSSTMTAELRVRIVKETVEERSVSMAPPDQQIKRDDAAVGSTQVSSHQQSSTSSEQQVSLRTLETALREAEDREQAPELKRMARIVCLYNWYLRDFRELKTAISNRTRRLTDRRPLKQELPWLEVWKVMDAEEADEIEKTQRILRAPHARALKAVAAHEKILSIAKRTIINYRNSLKPASRS